MQTAACGRRWGWFEPPRNISQEVFEQDPTRSMEMLNMAENDNETGKPMRAGMKRPGEYGPAGEMQGITETFIAQDVAAAFGVEIGRVHAAMRGEFALDASGHVDSRQAQHLAEVLLDDRPLDEREAALMKLGAFTPRPDHEWGAGEADPAEESDSQRKDQPGH